MIKEIQTKSIIGKTNIPGADYAANPYIGCSCGCIYCYAEFMKRFANHKEPWGKFVDAKVNANLLIKNPKKYDGKRILFSSVTDPYQPAEAKYGITRKILERLSEGNPEIEILTKSPLVTRDIDVLKRFEDASVGVSVSTLDERIARILEPGAAPPSARLSALRRCSDAGLDTYVFVSPIFPSITDIEEIVGADCKNFMFENLNIRPTNRAKIYSFLFGNFPELIPKYRKIFDEGDSSYWDGLKTEIRGICRKAGKGCEICFHHGGFS